jgi:hypothetical protein
MSLQKLLNRKPSAVTREIERACAQKGERPIQRALEKHPNVIYKALGQGGFGYVVPQFEAGNEYRSDFLLISTFSGGFDLNFVELEPPSAKLFQKNGNMTARLAGAFRQIELWKRFERGVASLPYLLQQITKAAESRNLLHPDSKGGLMCNAGLPITDPRVARVFHYYIVMGRRDDLKSDELSRKANFRNSFDLELITYDRLIEASR